MKPGAYFLLLLLMTYQMGTNSCRCFCAEPPDTEDPVSLSVYRMMLQRKTSSKILNSEVKHLPHATQTKPFRSPMEYSISQIDDASGFYTQNYPYLFIHYMAGFDIWKNTQEVLEYLGRFDNIWVGNVYGLPSSWVDYLHTHDGKYRKLFFYEFFPAVHFVFGKDNPQSYETWQVQFLDDHLLDYYTINPLIPPEFTEFSPGRWSPGSGWLDYFINYGNGEAEDSLANRYYDVKRADWGYDGVFFDLTGSVFVEASEIQDPNNASEVINAMVQYDFLDSTRDIPSNTYDLNGAGFLQRLRQKNPDLADFPLWGNQVFRSGNQITGQNEYYRYLNLDLDESTFSTWYNPDGWISGVRVHVDGVWYENACPVETKIEPFFDGVAKLQPMIQQAIYAVGNYGNSVQGVIANYLRPYYEVFEDGYRATVDREAIYYGYATAKVTGIPSYSWDYFDTVSNLTGVPGAPLTTGLPLQPYFKWSKDPVYFLDLGDYVGDLYETIDAGALGRKAVLRFFDKGFIVINATENYYSGNWEMTVDLSAHPNLKGLADDVHGYYDHFNDVLIPSSTKSFSVPAAYYPIADIHTNSARVYSYTDNMGRLIGTVSSVPSWLVY